MNFNTALLHAGEDRKEAKGATLPPVYQTSAFQHQSAEELAAIFARKKPGYNYTRTGNPTVNIFENKITKIEKGLASVATASGMAAIANVIFTLTNSGDEIVASNGLYGGTYYFFKDIASLGIKTHFASVNDYDGIEQQINEKTRLIYVESIANPGLEVADIEELAQIARKHQIPLVVDNTIATPYLLNPLEHGANIVINSSSKYINGSGSAISGVITDGGNFDWKQFKNSSFDDYLIFGKLAFIAKLRNSFARDMGACLAPQNAFLNILGLETLGLRMQKACSNALKLAEWFKENHPEVVVNYPGLSDCPCHETADKILNKGYGAILTIRVGSWQRAFALMNNLKLVFIISNIGDTKTLIIHPASTIALHNTQQEREQSGIYDDLLRISVGIEDVEDLIEDFKQAYEKAIEAESQTK